MSNLGTIAGVNNEKINLNLSSIKDLTQILKDAKQSEETIIQEITSMLDIKETNSIEYDKIETTEEDILNSKKTIEERASFKDVLDVTKGIEEFKKTVIEEIGKQREQTPVLQENLDEDGNIEV